eukprot:Pgem_evm1s3240
MTNKTPQLTNDEQPGRLNKLVNSLALAVLEKGENTTYKWQWEMTDRQSKLDQMIIQYNINSLKLRKVELEHLLHNNDIHICALNETKLTPTDTLEIRDYRGLRKERSQKKGGG